MDICVQRIAVHSDRGLQVDQVQAHILSMYLRDVSLEIAYRPITMAAIISASGLVSGPQFLSHKGLG